MHTISDPEDLRSRCRDWRCRGLKVALVPTMGFFHEGHLSLMRWAREHADTVVVSLFVNPTQFGPGEDLEAYPRDIERDRSLAAEAGVDILFCPRAQDVYAPDHATWIEVPALSGTLCGASRPHHFRGVCTIVAKLFVLTDPHVAVFGQKDWQQLAIIRRMSRDLGFATRIEGRPIVRESDGLAMSSRNAYLTSAQREQAPRIYQGLKQAEQWSAGTGDPADLIQRLEEWYLTRIPEGRIDYLAVVDPDTLVAVDRLVPPLLLAVAVRLGQARLIDNLLIRN